MQPDRVLIVSYYWPPAGGPGVQRWLKFAKYLPEFGVHPHLYIPENPSYPVIDASLEKEIPANCTIIKKPIWEPYAWAEKLSPRNKDFKAGQFAVDTRQSFLSKLSVFVRGNFFIPDARVFWVRPSAKFLERYVIENDIKTIITTGPPHSMHLIGLRLKKKIPALRWIADFRDPWTEISYHKHLKLTSWAENKHKQLENAVLTGADLVLATSYTDAENFARRGANAFCITNGFDEYLPPAVRSSGRFTISYIGMLEQLRNPTLLWEVLGELLQTDAGFAQDLKVQFVGKIDEAILHTLQGSPLKENIENRGYQSHQRARELMSEADLLMITNFPNESSRGIIPGKIFEYLASGNPILSFGPAHADVENILKTTQSGAHFTYHDKENVQRYILDTYARWKSGKEQHRAQNVDQFSRKNLTQKLVSLL